MFNFKLKRLLSSSETFVHTLSRARRIVLKSPKQDANRAG
jgi:hypothetical protein